jgi:WD40 repeat protein
VDVLRRWPACGGRWPEAAAASGKAVDVGPADASNWFCDAVLRLQTGDPEGYRADCREMLKRFGDTKDHYTADYTAKTCLLLPYAAPDSEPALKLARRPLAGMEKDPAYPWFLACKALAEYRAGRFDAAAEGIDRVQPNPNGGRLDATAYVILALAEQRRGHPAGARQALLRARALRDRNWPQFDRGQQFDVNWPDWLRCEVLRREAEALVDLNGQSRRLLDGPPLAGHTDIVTCVAYHPDGRLLATGSYDRTVRLWDLTTRQVVRALAGHTQAVWGLAFSPDGRRLASSGGNPFQRGTPAEIKFWDVDTGRQLRMLASPGGGVHGLAWSPDGKRLASAGFDRAVRLWDPDTGKEVRALQGHTNELWAVAFSPDGKRMASAGFDKAVRLWDAESGDPVRTLGGHTDVAWGVAFSPDGHRLASASDDLTVRVWDVASGKEMHALRGRTVSPYSVTFSRDGTRLLSASGHRWQPGHAGEVIAWDPATGQELACLVGATHGFFAAAFAPDGRHFACAAMDGSVKLCELAKAGQGPDADRDKEKP